MYAIRSYYAVIDVQVFTRDGVEKDARALQIQADQLAQIKA